MIIISNVVAFLLISYIANSFLSSKYSKNKYLLILLVFIVVESLINYTGASPIKGIILLIVYFLYVSFQFEGKVIQKILIVVPFFLIQVISEILVAFCFNNVLFIEVTRNTYSHGFLLGTIFSNAILASFVFIYVKIIEFIQVDDLPKYTWLALVFPIVSIVFLLNTDDYFGLLNTNPDILITTAGLAISNIILFVIFISVINSINMKHKLQAAKQKEELYDSKIELLSQHYNYNFEFLHDLLHTCNQLNSLVQDSKYSEATTVLNSLTDTAYKEFNAIYSNSYILNYVINNNLTRIINHNINIKTEIKYSDFDILDYFTQLTLFEYFVNLSIDSCMQATTTDKIIMIKSVKTANKIILKVFYSASSISEDIIAQNINEILLNKSCSLSIKVVDDKYASILLSFDISS